MPVCFAAPTMQDATLVQVLSVLISVAVRLLSRSRDYAAEDKEQAARGRQTYKKHIAKVTSTRRNSELYPRQPIGNGAERKSTTICYQADRQRQPESNHQSDRNRFPPYQRHERSSCCRWQTLFTTTKFGLHSRFTDAELAIDLVPRVRRITYFRLFALPFPCGHTIRKPYRSFLNYQYHGGLEPRGLRMPHPDDFSPARSTEHTSGQTWGSIRVVV